MRHRHINHRGFTLAAIDDIIGSGGWEDWVALRNAMARNDRVRTKILSLCTTRAKDLTEQRYRFWKLYAQEARPRI